MQKVHDIQIIKIILKIILNFSFPLSLKDILPAVMPCSKTHHLLMVPFLVSTLLVVLLWNPKDSLLNCVPNTPGFLWRLFPFKAAFTDLIIIYYWRCKRQSSAPPTLTPLDSPSLALSSFQVLVFSFPQRFAILPLRNTPYSLIRFHNPSLHALYPCLLPITSMGPADPLWDFEF